MSISKRLLALAISACVAAPVMAQESLIDVYRRALENDPAIREAEATYLATAEVKPQARSGLLPGLTLGAVRSSRYQDQAGGGIDPILGVPVGQRQVFDQDASGWSVSLTQTVFDWSQYATLRQADKQVVRAETDFQAAQQNLLLRVATAYFEVLAAEDNLASAVAARDSVSRQLEQSQRRFEVGLIAITDVQQSQAGFDDAVAVEIQAQRLLATSHEQLREIIGEIEMDLASPTDDLPLLTPDPANAEEWVQQALGSNLALLSSRLAAEIANDAIDIQRGNRLPTLNLSASYTDDTQDRTQTLYPTPGIPSAFHANARRAQLVAQSELSALHGWAQPLAGSAIGLPTPRGDRSTRAHRAPNGAPDS